MRLVTVCPSRGRPTNAHRLAEAHARLSTEGSRLVFGLDADDPTLPDYAGLDAIVGPRLGMAGTLNLVAVSLAESGNPPDVCGFMGDDHLLQNPRAWDARILDAVDRMQGGIAYGNDLFQGENLPTAVWLSTPIVRALGWMAPPQLRHLFLDNFWRDLGKALGRLRYLPDVIVEHVHPQAGKAEWDAGYQRVNGGEMWQADETAYEAFRSSGEFAAAVDRVREALR